MGADVAGSFLEVTEWPGHDAAELFEDADRTIAALRNQVEVLAALAGRPNTGLAQTAAVAVQSLALPSSVDFCTAAAALRNDSIDADTAAAAP